MPQINSLFSHCRYVSVRRLLGKSRKPEVGEVNKGNPHQVRTRKVSTCGNVYLYVRDYDGVFDVVYSV